MSHEFVEVIWGDAVSWAGWHELEGIYKPAMVITRGWLIHDEKEHVVLATSMNADEQTGPGGLWTIPRGMIKEIIPIVFT